eukprot:988055-Amphidinium_carterae.1
MMLKRAVCEFFIDAEEDLEGGDQLCATSNELIEWVGVLLPTFCGAAADGVCFALKQRFKQGGKFE